MDGAVGAAASSGAGASTVAIYCGSMIDDWEGQNETGSWIILDGYCWPILIKIDSSYESNQCAEDELHKK